MRAQIFLLVLVAACARHGTVVEEEIDDPADEGDALSKSMPAIVDDAAAAEALALRMNEQTGRVHAVVRTAEGRHVAPYDPATGMVTLADDIHLHVSPQAPSRGTTVALSEGVWFPDGRVTWYSKDLTNDGHAAARTAYDYFNDHTPLIFTEAPSDTGDVLKLRDRTGPADAFTGANETYGYWNPDPLQKNIIFEGGDPAEHTVYHETMHALGFKHMFQANDRDRYVDMSDCSTVWNDWNYSINTFGLVTIYGADLAPYDYHSCTNWGYDCPDPKRDADDRAPGGFRSQPSRRDLNSLYRVYGRELGTNETDDNFGRAVAAGDFDVDGFEDLVVASPDDNGRIFLYFYRGIDPHESEGGAPVRYMPWYDHLLVSYAGIANPAVELTVGDVNGDGYPDIIAGLPWVNEDNGEIRVLFSIHNWGEAKRKWAKKGLDEERIFHPADFGLSATAPMRFGEAILTGHFTDDDVEDILVGAPEASPPDNLAPARWVPTALQSIAANGDVPNGPLGLVVHLRSPRTDDVATWTPTGNMKTWYHGDQGSGNFGHSLAKLPDFCTLPSGAQRDTFVVGANEYNQSAGAFYVFGCAGDRHENLVLPPLVVASASSQQGAQYATSLAGFTTFDHSGHHYYLAVGAPKYTAASGTNPNAGKVYLREITPSGAITNIASFFPSTRTGGERTGESLAVYQHPTSTQPKEGVTIAIGAPQYKVNGIEAGRVIIWKPWDAAGAVQNKAWSVTAPSPSSTKPAKYGKRIAAIRQGSLFDEALEGTGIGFAVGAPGAFAQHDQGYQITNVFPGVVETLIEASDTADTWSNWRMIIHQEVHGDRRPINL